MTGPHDNRPVGPFPDPRQPPPWAGAPGYTAHPQPAPHGPMPGAPPYPAAGYPPPPPGPRSRTSFGAALGAAAVWAAAFVALILVLAGPPSNAEGVGYVTGSASVSALLTALVVWAVTRRRAWPFWQLVLVSAPVFVVFRVIAAAGAVASGS